MKEIMNWQKCEKEFIRKVDVDIDKIRSIVKMAKIEFEIISKIPIADKSAPKLAKDYYEIIKELMTELLLSKGIKSGNHECLIAFIKEYYPQYEYEINIIHESKNVRNRVSYDGFFVNKDYIEKNKLEFKHIIGLLNKLIMENVPQMGHMG